MARIRKATKQEGTRKKWLFGKYNRLSKEDLKKGLSRSIISQNMMLDNYIDNLIDQGEDIVVVDEYIDDGTSGMYDTNREEFQRMINDIENGRINAIIVCDLSRMFRNDGDQKYYLEYYFREKKIRIISCSLPCLDTYKEPDRVFSMDVKFQGMSNANMPIENSLKIKQKLKIRREGGLYVGSQPPYGFKKDLEDKNKLLIDEEAAEVVKDIYNWFVYENLSMNKIVRKLNELGIDNPTAYKQKHGYNYTNSSGTNSGLWCAGTIKYILTKQYYIGNMDQHSSKTVFTSDKKKIVQIDDDEKEEIVEYTHEAIIDKEVYLLAEKLLTRDRRTSPTQTHFYLFSGFLECGDCHKSMVSKHSKNINYYYCSTYVRKSKTACTKHTFREDTLHIAVLKAIQLQVALAVDMKEQVDNINKMGKVNNTSIRIEKLLKDNQTALLKQENIQDNLYIDWKNGDISKEQHSRLRSKTEDKIISIKQSIKRLLNEKNTLESNMRDSIKYLETFCKYKNIKELNSKILVELVNKIYIYENNVIEVNFNYHDEFKLTMEFIENNQ